MFFSAGIWLQKTGFNMERKPKWISMYIMWLFFIGFAIIKTFMAFELEKTSAVTFWALNVLHDVSVLCGIVAVWYGCDRIVRWAMRRQWFVWTTAFSFFVFGLHAPLVIYVSRLSFIFFNHVPEYRLLTYLIVPAIVLGFCLGVGAAVRAWTPQVYRYITGEEDFNYSRNPLP